MKNREYRIIKNVLYENGSIIRTTYHIEERVKTFFFFYRWITLSDLDGSYASFNSEEEALKTMEKIKTQGISNGWKKSVVWSEFDFETISKK